MFDLLQRADGAELLNRHLAQPRAELAELLVGRISELLADTDRRVYK
ncbi:MULTISPECIES: hypothetical protein [unclassified Micromonospora]